MPLPNSAVDALGFATLLLVLVLLFLGLLCAAYVLHFRSKIRHDNLLALRHFNSLWIVRLVLVLLAVLWGLGELLRLPLLRKKGWFLHGLAFHWQVTSCKIYILSSLGVLEPCFFLTALFLVQGSIRRAPFTPRKRWNATVMASVLGFCAPVFLAQVFLVVLCPILWGGGHRDRGGVGYRSGGDDFLDRYKLPHYFTRIFQAMEMEAEEREKVAVCTYPLLSTMVLGLFGCVYVIYFLYLGWKMAAVVINRRLQARVYALVAAVALLLPVHVVLLGISVLSRPSEPLFETAGFLGFLTVLLCTTVGEGILVVRPIADALAIRWRYEHAACVKASSLWEPPVPPPSPPPRSLSQQQCHRAAVLDEDDASGGGGAEAAMDKSRDFFLPKAFQAAMMKTSSSSSPPTSPSPSPSLPGRTLLSYTNRILV